MLKDTSRIDLCKICEYADEVFDGISLSVNGIDYYRVDCKKGNCDAGNGFVKAKTPKQFTKKIPEPEPLVEDEYTTEPKVETSPRRRGRPKKV